MKTIVISYRYPLPANGGDKIRTMNFVNYFNSLGSVDVVFYEPTEERIETGAPFRKAFHVDVYKNPEAKGRLVYLYEKIKFTKPWSLGDFSDRSIAQIVEIIKEGNYDCIFCRNALTALPLFFFWDPKKANIILDIDDIITKQLHGSAISIKPDPFGLHKLKMALDFELYRVYQIRCSRLGKSLICSETDRKQLNRLMDADKVFVVPNTTPKVELPVEYAEDGHGNIGTFLFVGHLSYLPNVQGIIWFINEIFRMMLKCNEQFKLVIIGKDPVLELRDVCNKYPQIDLVDTPPDVLPYYEKCGAVIVPLLSGGGTRIKILEAGYALRPVLTTRIGAYGLNLADYEDALYFDDFDSFMDRHNWLKIPANYKNVTDNLFSHVSDNYSTAAFDRAMDKVLAL